LNIRADLQARGVKPESLHEEIVDVTNVFEGTKCVILSDQIGKGGSVLALRLSGFEGLLGTEINPNRRLGTEMAERARFWGKVAGIFHTDELPNYGITEEDVERIRTLMGFRGGMLLR